MRLRCRLIILIVVAGLALAAGGCRKRASQAVEPPQRSLPNRLVHVLCYHNVAATAANAYDTSVADFQAQLGALKAGGYQAISCADLAAYSDGQKDLPDKAVLITFDDGRKSVLTVAKPMLDKVGYKATLFLITDAVGGKGSLTWADVSALMKDGYEIGSHTSGHLNLTKVPKGRTLVDHQATVRKQIEGAATEIEEKTGQVPVALAYPYGNYDTFAMQTARNAGHRMAFSIDPGAIDNQSNPWLLPRKMIVNGTSLKSFERALRVEPLHLTGVQPAVGERYRGKAYRLQVRVADPDALATLGAEAGKKTHVKVDAQTSLLTVSGTLNKGANLVRLFSSGTPRRETGWIVVCDP